MELKTLEAQTQPITDLGEFEAIAAAWTEDREKDVIHRGAFAGTIKQWRRSGKRMPLHWQHEGGPEKIIGHIDPMSMQERDDGLFVKGQVDLEGSELGRQAWRLIKNGVVGLSFGYLPTQEKARKGGGRDLHELDMFEISITPAPMHPDTRILATKGIQTKWDGSASRYTDAQYAAATILDRADCDASLKGSPAKVRYAVPIANPGSSASESPDRGGVVAAAGGHGITVVKACPAAKANAARRLIAAYGKFDGLEVPDSIRALVSGKAHVSDTPHPEPFSTSTTSNWVARAGGLPEYIQDIAHGLLRGGHADSESKAIEMAVGIVKNWAAGEGGVTDATKAKAAAAVAEWERKKAEAHATPNKPGKAMQPDEDEPAGDAGQVQRLQDMIDEGNEFVAAEADGSDSALMQQVLSILTMLLTGERSEARDESNNGKSLAPGMGAEGADGTGGREPRRVDPLRKQAEALMVEVLTDGVDLSQSPPPKAPKPEPEYSNEELRQRARDEMLIALSGIEDIDE